jgi:hypothetical protein
VSVLKQLHDDLDAAVLDAYNWPRDLAPDALLEHLVSLNAERAREEQDGRVRWLRPDLQTRGAITTAAQNLLPGTETPLDADTPAAAAIVATDRLPWPRTLPEQVRVVQGALATRPGIVTAEQLAARFQRARADRVAELLQTWSCSAKPARSRRDGFTV